MIRQIKYRKKIYIFPADNDPLEWAYQIFRYNNPNIPGMAPIPEGYMLVALTERAARKKAELVRDTYNMFFYPPEKETIHAVKELICAKYPHE